MSSAHAVSKRHSSKKSIGLVALMILSSLGGILLAPTASASVSGDYEITTSISPRPDIYMSAWDPVYIEVQVKNSGFFYNSESRSLEWFVCEGFQTETDCYNDREDYGIGSIEPLAIGASLNYSFNQPFNSFGDEGPYTLIYRFIDSDTVTSNDVAIFNFNLAQKLVDVSIDEQDPISQLENLAEYNGKFILNTDTDYVMSMDGIVSSCGSCGLEADLGWKLVDSFGVELANSSTTYTSLPNWGAVAFTRDLPALNFDSEGTYTMHFGILDSIGTPSGDMNSFNDLQSVEVVFDDTVDLQISSMFPLNSPTSADYFYGNDSVAVTISNLGNHSVVGPLVRFTVMDLDEQIESEEDCFPTEIVPGEVETCIFDLNELGDKKLKVFVSEALNEGVDAKPSDNILNAQAEVIVGEINPIIEQSNFYGTYNTADNITFTARTLPTAAGPLTYKWYRAGIQLIAEGQEVTVPASQLGLGDHFIQIRAYDSLNNLESATTLITVFNSTDISQGDWMNGSAVTRTHAKGVVEYDYPLAGVNYGPGVGLEALIRMSIDVVSTTEEPSAGMDWMEFDINLTKIIPDNVPRESIAMHQLLGYNQLDWDPLDSGNYYQLIDNDTLRVHINQNMDLLLVGELPSPEINLSNPELTLLPDGQMQLDWNATGDIENPYFGGWKIYRVTSPITASTYFPDPEVTDSEFIWNGLMQGALSATLEATTTSWIDERGLETGICSSYAIIPTDRTGEPDFLEAKVTLANGAPGLTCGDAIDPNSEVSGLSASIAYNNDTACFDLYNDWHRCYELTLKWTWPDNEPEGEITWNMYRIEQKPSDVDLRYIEPIATGLVNIPGEEGSFIQYGTEYDGIAPYRTYYYILTPLDSVGNEFTLVDYPSQNVERVYIEDQYWQYNEYRIPEPEPEPEPPYGVEWLGDLQDYMGIENFQIAGMVMLLTIIINFIGLPLILKKRKRMKRVIAKRAANNPANLDDEFEDFFN